MLIWHHDVIIRHCMRKWHNNWILAFQVSPAIKTYSNCHWSELHSWTIDTPLMAIHKSIPAQYSSFFNTIDGASNWGQPSDTPGHSVTRHDPFAKLDPDNQKQVRLCIRDDKSHSVSFHKVPRNFPNVPRNFIPMNETDVILCIFVPHFVQIVISWR